MRNVCGGKNVKKTTHGVSLLFASHLYKKYGEDEEFRLGQGLPQADSAPEAEGHEVVKVGHFRLPCFVFAQEPARPKHFRVSPKLRVGVELVDVVEDVGVWKMSF